MCPTPSEGVQHANGHVDGIENTHVGVDTTTVRPPGSGANGTPASGSANGAVNGALAAAAHSQSVAQANAALAAQSPFNPRYSDFLSNVSNFKIIESTLRGECFGTGWKRTVVAENAPGNISSGSTGSGSDGTARNSGHCKSLPNRALHWDDVAHWL